jgi:transposase-like protein
MTRACSTLVTLTIISKVSWSEIRASTNFQPMRMEREQFFGVGHYQPVSWRLGYANGYKSKKVDTPAGSRSVSVPKATDHLEVCGEPFFPQSLERGWRSSSTVIRAVAEMYIKGVSTRDAEAVMKEFSIESLASTQVSQATKLLDDELFAWRSRS